MRKLLVPSLIILFLLTSCSFESRRELTLVLERTHLWEYLEDKPMWYKLVWFDGIQVREQTLSVGVERVSVTVQSGSTCVFAAYPLDSLAPLGGGFSPGMDDEVILTFDSGPLAQVLLDVVSYDPSIVRALSYPELLELVPEGFDTDALYEDFVDGSLGKNRIPLAKTFTVELPPLPEGRYWGEFDEGPVFDSTLDGTVTLTLRTGINRFYNSQLDLVHIVALYPDGNATFYNYILSGW